MVVAPTAAAGLTGTRQGVESDAAERALTLIESAETFGDAGSNPLIACRQQIAARLRAGLPWEPPATCLSEPIDALHAWAVSVATTPAPMAALVRFDRCGPEFDFLGDPDWHGLDWARSDPRRRLLHAVRSAARALHGTARPGPLVVTSIRNEAPHLLEWVAYYRALGLRDILVYSNDNTDGSDALLHALATRGLITWHDNACAADVSPQIKAFEHALFFSTAALGAHRAAFLDADEYLVPATPQDRPGAPASGALDALFGTAAAGSPVGAIALHWRWFTHDARFTAAEGLIAERYTRARTDTHVKCVVDLSATFSMRKIHLPTFGPGGWTVLDAEGERFDERRDPRSRALAAGQVNHYWSTSFLDYALKKQRGRGAVGPSGEQRAFNQFFDWGSPRHCPDDDLRIRPWLAAQATELERLLADSAIRRAHCEARAIYDETIARMSVDPAMRRLFLDGCMKSGVAPHPED